MGAISFSIDKNLLLLFQQKLRVATFVETGTYQGDSLRVAADIFADCRSIELSNDLHEDARRKFAAQANIKLYQGSSPGMLNALCEEMAERPVVFWLDAHWCVGENTAGQDSQSPLLDELRAIKKLHAQSVILIDDARLYLCPPPEPHRAPDWPDFDDIVILLKSLGHGHRLMILNDVIVLYPESIRVDMASFARQQGVDWLVLANHALRPPPPARPKRRTWLRKLGLSKQ